MTSDVFLFRLFHCVCTWPLHGYDRQHVSRIARRGHFLHSIVDVCVGVEDIVGILTRTKVIVTWTMILGRLSVLELVIIKVNLSNQRHRLDK